ncbi:MAG TPA: hypothetical protein VMB85_18730 [Bryobacteraceae bacterium]|nr:hypothetical protein [Bryobacteraceae bacterium]
MDPNDRPVTRGELLEALSAQKQEILESVRETETALLNVFRLSGARRRAYEEDIRRRIEHQYRERTASQ